VAYLTTGVLASLYWLLDLDWLVILSNWIEVGNMAASIGLIISLGFATKYASTSEIEKELKSSVSPEEELKNAVNQLIKRFGAEEFIKKVNEYLPVDLLNVSSETTKSKPARTRRKAVTKTKKTG
jgi:hypothetical protein